ncbi:MULTISPECIES: DUF1269 domain-containing protein [Ramlibacter]|jgi:hypothetical protein|uniref:DUF1269 domain-containing protein n=1 Tax=Ramlibacter pinisoli TaxID=2682844 RepID=A0A6N8IUX4_9BURK|nr:MULTISPECIES: DUF1269 domain-containing protein [Ramlibacter]MBA2965401.1 DUF1269 domain-containing protein [Ramlibacter sp. CGMCC 1.13660]MVQ30365.1 DUF1269 domain-containing protein [Ramlibacter pinisoli]
MHSRIYWLLPDVESARRTMDDLLLARIPYNRMHFVGREGSDMRGLHAANVLQTSDIVRSAEVGLILGAATGALVGGLVAVFYPIVGDQPQWMLAPALAVAGALFGTWASTMLGISTPSKRLARFTPQIEEGQILLMVDVPMWNVEAIEARLRALHPEAHLEGTEPDIPAFP